MCPCSLQEAYNNVAIESRVTFLLSAILNDALGEELRQMAAVLLRRLFSAEFMDFYPKVCYMLVSGDKILYINLIMSMQLF
jgi:hypothetical protein